jgi:ABC-type uncharacterized transport system permease subunit
MNYIMINLFVAVVTETFGKISDESPNIEKPKTWVREPRYNNDNIYYFYHHYHMYIILIVFDFVCLGLRNAVTRYGLSTQIYGHLTSHHNSSFL